MKDPCVYTKANNQVIEGNSHHFFTELYKAKLVRPISHIPFVQYDTKSRATWPDRRNLNHSLDIPKWRELEAFIAFLPQSSVFPKQHKSICDLHNFRPFFYILIQALKC